MKDIDKRLTWWTWTYDTMLWVFTIIFDLFFREITSRGSFRIPKNGPVIFVGAPHANQFVDPMILMQRVKYGAGRRVSFLIAENSLKRRFINLFAKATSAISVARAQDNLKLATGTIRLDAQNPLKVIGEGTKFTKEAEVRGLVGLPKSVGNAEIAEIVSDTELILRKEFKGSKALQLLKEGTVFKTAPHINQSSMYNRVFTHLSKGGCIGIFPEGGSHDRTELLPLKAGVAIMALGALADHPDCGLKIVPCGMNYFHAHKFRSRAVIEFGAPLEISAALVEQYKKGGDEKRAAVKETLDSIYDSLGAVTVQCPDYDTLMLIQAARRLYRPTGKRMPLSMIVELNRRLLKGYDTYKEDPEIIRLQNEVAAYNKQLKNLGIKDHQVETASLSPEKVIFKLVYRSIKLMFLLIGSLPGLILFAPVFILTKAISRKKAKEALAGSTVKIAARDVLATWKLLVAMAVTPLLYSVYAFLFAFIAWRHELVQPTWKGLFSVVLAGYIILPLLSVAALLTGETGMDIFKSLKPLALALNPAQKNTVEKLRRTRQELVVDVTQLVNTVGPELYPDFGKHGFQSAMAPPPVDADDDELAEQARQATIRERLKRRDSSMSTRSQSDGMSRVGSENDLASMPLFSTGPYVEASVVNSPGEPIKIGGSGALNGSASSQRLFQSEVSRRILESRSKREEANGDA